MSKNLALVLVSLAGIVEAGADAPFFTHSVKDWLVFGQVFKNQAQCIAMKNFGREAVLNFVLNPGDPHGKIAMQLDGKLENAPRTPPPEIVAALRKCQRKFEDLYNE